MARGSAPVFASNLIALAFSFAKSILIARALGVDLYGLFAYSIALAMFAAQFLRANTSDSIVRFVGVSLAADKPRRATAFFHWGIIVEAAGAVLVILALRLIVMPVAAGHPRSDLLLPMVAAYSLAVPFMLLKGPFDAVLTALKKFKLAAVLQVLVSSIDLAVVVMVLPRGALALVRGLAQATAITSAASIVVGGWVFWRTTRVWRGDQYRAAWRDLRPFVLYGGLQATLKSLTKNLAVIVLGALRPASEVGFYTLAHGAVSIVSTVTGPILRVAYPLMNDAWARRDLPALRQVARNCTAIIGCLAASAAAILFIGGDRIVAQLYGPAYLSAASLMRVLVIAIGLAAAFGWLRKLLLILGRPKLDWQASLAGTALFLILLVPVVQSWGSLGLSGLLLFNVLFMIAAYGWLVSNNLQESTPATANSSLAQALRWPAGEQATPEVTD
jgi:O-antigen/teichoic acid export membrane protein